MRIDVRSFFFLYLRLISAISHRDLLTSDVYLSFSSLYWLTGLWALIRGTLAGLTRIITTQPFDPDLMLRLIEKYAVSITLTAPSHVARLLQCPNIGSTNLSTMRNYICSGSSLAPELLDKVKNLLPTGILIAYGMSEGCGIIAANEERFRDSVGALSDGMLVQIVDEDGVRRGPNEDGEVFLRAPIQFLGYCGNDVATTEAVDEDGWFRTGDMGHFDENGFLYVVDRKKDILKYRNYQISPTELENVIMRCNGVASVCVVGIPDGVSIDLPAALIVRAVGMDVDGEDIKAIIKGKRSNPNLFMKKAKLNIFFVSADQLSDAKQLRGGVYFVDSFPVTPSGKVLRRKVKEIAIQMYNNKL